MLRPEVVRFAALACWGALTACSAAEYGNVTNHRPTPVTCPATTSPDNGDGGVNSSACQTSADCLNMGHCTAAHECSYDACTQDQDCGATAVCSCQGQTFGWAHQSNGNTCVPSNCRQDSDCGAGGRCSPTLGYGSGPFYGIEGYFCHTPNDHCHNDSDCSNAYCEFDEISGYWSCNAGAIAG